MNPRIDHKRVFEEQLRNLADSLQEHVSTDNGQWSIKGFVDIFRNIYTISSDTKVISKILEIHLFPRLQEFAAGIGYGIVLADHQNYYPDFSFVNLKDNSVKFAVDLKTTYRLPEYPGFCRGFTLGSHGKYFVDRNSTKNIQFPYCSYLAHYCLGVIYSRQNNEHLDEQQVYPLTEIESILSVIEDIQFFVVEKWKIASDKQGSKNTANIGSIERIEDIVAERGLFSELGENWFDDYWMNYGKITTTDAEGNSKKITNLRDFVEYLNGDLDKIVNKARRIKQKT